MQYRLYAIYERSRTLLVTLGALWAAEVVAMVVIIGLSHDVLGISAIAFFSHTCSPA